MIMMEIEVSSEEPGGDRALKDSISGIIGLAGKRKGVLAIHLPKEVAMAITGSFLGMDVTEINEDVEDAVGELANMLGGNIKTILSERGRDIELSMPSTISGQHYDFQSTKDAERIAIPFICEAGKFCVDLQLEK
jgi:chemotaxis protein CheX